MTYLFIKFFDAVSNGAIKDLHVDGLPVVQIGTSQGGRMILWVQSPLDRFRKYYVDPKENPEIFIGEDGIGEILCESEPCCISVARS